MEQIRWCHDCQIENPLATDHCLHCGGWNTVVTTKGTMGWQVPFLDRRSTLLLLGLVGCVAIIITMVILS